MVHRHAEIEKDILKQNYLLIQYCTTLGTKTQFYKKIGRQFGLY